MGRILAAVVAALGVCAAVTSCGSVSCPKGQSWQITGMYWVPAAYHAGRTVEEEVSAKPIEFVPEWFPGYWIYGHYNYIYGCKGD